LFFRPRVKVCGITNPEDAQAAVQCGAEALGFIFHEPSARNLAPDRAKEMIRDLPPFVSAVGVFVNRDISDILEIASYCRLDVIQLHGEEDPDYCTELLNAGYRILKAIRVKDEASLRILPAYSGVTAFLLDSFSSQGRGGTGESFDWNLARSARRAGRIILAGGLTPENVGEAVAVVHPYGLDISSGVEKEPGRKDHKKLEAFFRGLRNAIY